MGDPTRSVWAAGSIRPGASVGLEETERALRYGDGFFTTIRLRRGLLLDLPAHLDRLAGCAALLGLDLPRPLQSEDGVIEIARRLGAGPGSEAVVRVQVTASGGGDRGYARRAAAAWDLVEILPPPAERHLTVALLGEGEAPAPALPGVKSCSALAHVLCAGAAARHGVAEAIRVIGGHLLEAAASNLFWVSGGVLCTPSASLPLYPGVTRSVVLDIAARSGWETREDRFAPGALSDAGAAFLTNASRGVEPIAELGGERLPWPAELESLRTAVEEARQSTGRHLTEA